MNKFYYELIIEPKVYYELFLDLVSSLTLDAIEEQDGKIIVRSEENLSNIEYGVKQFKNELEIAFDTKIECKISLTTKENKDWILIYQNSVKPIIVDNFYIHPSWEKPKENLINITIDPTLAFGSGHHETTSTCLKAISKYITPNKTLCDIGTGSGILAIAAAKKDAIVDICDTDEIAIEDAKKNFLTNKVTFNKAWIGSASKTKTQYDITLANIVADVLIFIHKDLKKITKKDGIIILSGIMDQYLNKVIDKFINNNYILLEQIQENEWVTLIIKKVENE